MVKTIEEIKLRVALTLQHKYRRIKMIKFKPDAELKELNQKAMKIMSKETPEKAVEFMFNPTGKKKLTYAEMRMYFG